MQLTNCFKPIASSPSHQVALPALLLELPTAAVLVLVLVAARETELAPPAARRAEEVGHGRTGAAGVGAAAVAAAPRTGARPEPEPEVAGTVAEGEVAGRGSSSLRCMLYAFSSITCTRSSWLRALASSDSNDCRSNIKIKVPIKSIIK